MADEVVVRGRWIDGISAQVADTARKVKQEFSLLNVASLALGTIGGLSITTAFSKITSTLKESAQATIEQERADRALENALRSQGKLTQERFDALKNYAGELQRTSAFTDDQVQQAQALAIALGVDTDKITQLSDAAAVLSVSLGMDLSSAMRALVKGEIGGMESALTRLIGKFDSFDEATAKLAGKRHDIVDLQLGPKEREAHDLKVKIDELREATGGAGLAFENMGQRISLATLGAIEDVQQLADILKELAAGNPGQAAFDAFNKGDWKSRTQGHNVGPQTFTADPNALTTDQITGTAPANSAKILADWKKQQAEYEADRKAFVDDLIADRQKWVDEFTRLMGYEPKMPTVTIGADGKPAQGAGYRNIEDMGVGAQQDFERARAVQKYRKDVAGQNGEDYLGGFQDAVQVIDATGQSIDEMTAIVGEAQKWVEKYTDSKGRETASLKLAEDVSGAVADSFEENFSSILDGTESFWHALGDIFAAGLSQLIDTALNSLGSGGGGGGGNWLNSAFQWAAGAFGGGGGGAAAGTDTGGVFESSARMGTQPVYNVNFYAGGNSTAAAGAMAAMQPAVPIGALGQDFDEILEGYIIPRVLKSVGMHMQRGR